MKQIIMIVLLLLVTSIEAKQKFYKWVDIDGNTHYSEKKPVDKNTSEVKIHNKISKENTKIYVSNADKEKSKQGKLAAKGEKSEDELAVENFNKSEKERAEKNQNSANCKIAKQNLKTLQQTTRVRRKDPDSGEFIRMDDKLRIKMINTSKKAINKLCKK